MCTLDFMEVDIMHFDTRLLLEVPRLLFMAVSWAWKRCSVTSLISICGLAIK